MIACPLFATEGKVFSKQIRGDSGSHRREGIFIANGPQLLAGRALPEVSILDLAPTIMHLLGRPLPAIMDGRVLNEIFAVPPTVTYDEAEIGTNGAGYDFDEAQAAQVEDRLRSLGYL